MTDPRMLLEDEMDGMCPRCKCCSLFTEGVDCGACGGEGFFDEHDDDPINYAPGELERPCEVCDGQGRYVISTCTCDSEGRHGAEA